MEELRSFYRGWMKVLVGLVVAFVVAYRLRIEPWVAAALKPYMANVTARWSLATVTWVGSILAGVLFLAGEAFIRTQWWRLLKPGFDFRGSWRGRTTYRRMVVGTHENPVDSHQTFDVGHAASIWQSCIEIRIDPTGLAYSKFNSLAMELIGRTDLWYAYKVDYKDRETHPFPASAEGYEKLYVAGTRTRWFRTMPVLLEGSFGHCVSGAAPLYAGTVVFERLDSKGNVISPDTTVPSGGKVGA